MSEIPHDVQSALAGLTTDFVVRSRHPVSRRGAILLGLVAVVLAVGAILVAYSFANGGQLTVTTNGESRVIEPGSAEYVRITLTTLGVLGLLSSIFATVAIVGRRIPGSWFAGTPGGLVRVGHFGTTTTPWTEFLSADLRGSSIALLRPSSRSRGRRARSYTYLSDLADPGPVLAACRARIEAARPTLRAAASPVALFG